MTEIAVVFVFHSLSCHLHDSMMRTGIFKCSQAAPHTHLISNAIGIAFQLRYWLLSDLRKPIEPFPKCETEIDIIDFVTAQYTTIMLLKSEREGGRGKGCRVSVRESVCLFVSVMTAPCTVVLRHHSTVL